jgi:hypothetical protein
MPLSPQSWLPRRPSISSASSPSDATNATNATCTSGHASTSKLKGKDRSLASAASDCGYGHSEYLLFCLSQATLRDQRGGGAQSAYALAPSSRALANALARRQCRYFRSYRDLLDALSPFIFCKDADNLDSKSSDSSPSATAYGSSHSVPLHSHFQPHSSSLPSRHRTSLLSVASDAFGLRKKISSASRKKPKTLSLPYTSNIVPGVIEISACNNTTVTSSVGGTTAHRDHEHEERERLRDVAAQSIGLDPELLHDSCKSASQSLLDSPQSPPQPARIPPFPATLAALRPFTELSATLPKFTPPSSLLVYALAKQWKPRTIVLTSHSPSQKTHVHLFKGASKDEKELERLEVTEHSVIFVAEEVVGGRGNVVKFAGRDASPKRSGAIGEESLRTMWLLQIKDPVESHRWIAAIKNAVLTQRYSLLSFVGFLSSNG